MSNTILLVLSTVLACSCLRVMPGSSLEGSPIPWPFQICGEGPWTMKSLTLSAVPSRNLNDEFIATGIANSHIEFDHVDIEVRLNGLFLHGETVKYGNVYDQGDKVEFKYSSFVPSFSPAGTYVMIFNFRDSANQAMGCFNFSFKL